MKRLIELMGCLLIALSCIGFYSCSSSDDDEGNTAYTMTDEEAVTILQGSWNVITTEYDEEEGDVTDDWIWTFSGNNLRVYDVMGDRGEWDSTHSFKINNGIFTVGNGSNADAIKIISLTNNRFEFNDKGIDGREKITIKIVGTRTDKPTN